MDILAPRLRHERRFPDEAAYAAWLFNACAARLAITRRDGRTAEGFSRRFNKKWVREISPFSFCGGRICDEAADGPTTKQRSWL